MESILRSVWFVYTVFSRTDFPRLICCGCIVLVGLPLSFRHPRCSIQARSFRMGDEQSRLIVGQWTNGRGSRDCWILSKNSPSTVLFGGRFRAVDGREGRRRRCPRESRAVRRAHALWGGRGGQRAWNRRGRAASARPRRPSPGCSSQRRLHTSTLTGLSTRGGQDRDLRPAVPPSPPGRLLLAP